MFFLVLDIVANKGFIQPHRAHTITTRPEATPKKRPFGTHQFAVNPDRTFALQISNSHSDTVLGRYTQQHMNMIGSRIAFQKLDIFLTTQFSYHLAYFLTKFSKLLFSSIFWYNNYMILTFPLHVGLTLPIFHDGSPCPSGPSSRENHYKTHVTAEPYKFSPAEPVDYDFI